MTDFSLIQVIKIKQKNKYIKNIFIKKFSFITILKKEILNKSL